MAPHNCNTTEEKSRLKPSDEVFSFIRNDPRFDPRLCSIVYLDRQRHKRQSAHDWLPINQGGDIPFHRVYAFEYKGQVFWDREARTYDVPLLLRLAAGEGLPPFRNLRQPADAAALPDALPHDFTIVSQNVLFDLFEHRITRLEPRLPRLSQALSALNADVILLQECTPKVLEFLKQADWVAQGYALAHTDLEEYGQITLARCRIDPQGNNGAEEEALTEHKKVLRVTLAVSPPPPAPGAVAAAGGDAPMQPTTVDVWNVHFPAKSDGSAGDRARDDGGGRGRSGGGRGGSRPAVIMTRGQQLERVEFLARGRVEEGLAAAAVVAGDFNVLGEREPGDAFSGRRGWRDVWAESVAERQRQRRLQQQEREVAADDAGGAQAASDGGGDNQQEQEGEDTRGYTYDPRRNALAGQLSRTQQPRRLDRAMVLGSLLEVKEVSVFGPGISPPLSDHWALVTRLSAAGEPRGGLEAAAGGQGDGGDEEEEGEPARLGPGELTVKTALAWVPPPEVWAPLQAIRSRHDPKYGRIMPHIHVAYPFVAPGAFAQFAAAAKTKPFNGRSDNGDGGRQDSADSGACVSGLVHGGSATVVVQPGARTCQSLRELHLWAHNLIGVPPVTQPHPYTPHLSLARIRGEQQQEDEGKGAQEAAGSSSGGSATIGPFSPGDSGQAARQYRALIKTASASVLPVLASAWAVRRLCLISRDGSTDGGNEAGFVVKRILSLPGVSPVNSDAALAALRAGLPRVRFCAVGSRLLLAPSGTGGKLPVEGHLDKGQLGDLDVLASCDMPHAEALACIKGWMETCGLFYNVYEVVNEHTTFLRGWEAGGLELDVHTLQWPPALTATAQPSHLLRHLSAAAAPWDLPDAELALLPAMLSSEQGMALSMLSESRWLRNVYVGSEQVGRYQACLAAVRSWARGAGIYGQSYAYPGGIAWGIMVAVAMRQSGLLLPPATAKCDAAASGAKAAATGASEGVQGGGSGDAGSSAVAAVQPEVVPLATTTDGGFGAVAVVAEMGGQGGDDNRDGRSPSLPEERVSGRAGPGRQPLRFDVQSDVAAVLGYLASSDAWIQPMAARSATDSCKRQQQRQWQQQQTQQTPADSVVDDAAAEGAQEAGGPTASAVAATCRAWWPEGPLGLGAKEVQEAASEGWWRTEAEGGLAPRWQDMPEVQLATLPGANTIRRMLPSTVALMKLALRAGAARPAAAAAAVAAAKRLLPYRLTLHLKAEDVDDARLAVNWLLRHLHKLLVFMDKECVTLAPDHEWSPDGGSGGSASTPSAAGAKAGAADCSPGSEPGLATGGGPGSEPESGAEAEDEGASMAWGVHYARDCTRLHVVVDQLMAKFHAECGGVALWATWASQA